MSDHHEVERAYEVGPDDVLPDWTLLPGVVVATEPETAVLVASYVDTPTLALVRHGVTLRRRTGGSDAGWHLKVPAGDGRDEVHRPLGAGTRVPAPLRRLVTGWSRGETLRAVAVIETRRTTRLLLDADGATLAEVADDVVVGTPVGGGPVTGWREVEVELVTADAGLLDAADALLAEHGIVPRTEQRKIGTVLAHRLGKARTRAEPDPDGPAAAVLHHRLAELVADLGHYDSDVRRGVPDGVHQLRVTCRRLRGALATYRPMLDERSTEPVRNELRWVARTLGDGRDAEVMHELLRGLVAEVPRSLTVGPVRRRVDRSYAARLRAADGHAQAVLTSPRYLRLLTRLDRLAVAPRWSARARDPADEVMRALVKRDWRRLRKRVDLAQSLSESDDVGRLEARDEALHDVRKAAKRLRYACEALEAGWPDAKALRKAVQEVTQVLGDRQDAAVARRDLKRVAAEADAAGESSFTYGVLHARQAEQEARLEHEFAGVWERVRRPELRAWLD